jgi:glycosyltransferase involved in cell wall biosynthesis
MTKPTYLIVSPWSLTNPGGVDQVILNLYREFGRTGIWGPHVLISSWNDVAPRTTVEDGLTISYLRLRRPIHSAWGVASLFGWLVTLPMELPVLARFIRDNRVTVVNIHFSSIVAIQFLLVRIFYRLPFQILLSFHGMDVVRLRATRGIERWLARRLFRMLRTTDAVVTCSASLAESVLTFAPTARKLTATIHNGLDIEHFLNSRHASAEIEPALRHRPFILCIAAYEHKKGLDTLVRAFRLVRSGYVVPVRLVLIGADRGLGRELAELAIELGLEEDVLIRGEVPHEELHKYYERATIFCLPSRSEPFGIVLLEAGAFRCAVVATSVGGIPEIITDCANGLLVPPDDPEALATQLLYLLNDEAERRRLGDALFEHVTASFTWRAAYRSYVGLLLTQPK